MNGALAGTIAGFLATGPMTLAMNAMYRELPPEDKDPLPPRQITENAAAAVGVDLGTKEETRQAATLAAHFGYGATVGAMYGPLAGRTGLPRVAEGMIYGAAIWGGSYFGLLPGVGLYRSANEEAPSRNALMLTAHLVWGASVGLIVGALVDDDR
jgi:F0F1-type ATP synthase assembly protein I